MPGRIVALVAQLVPETSGLEVVGSRCGPFEPAIDALMNDTIDVESLIEERFPLRNAAQALERAAKRGIRKILIDCH